MNSYKATIKEGFIGIYMDILLDLHTVIHLILLTLSLRNTYKDLSSTNFYRPAPVLLGWTVLMNSYKATIKVSIIYWIINWILILVIIHLKMGYKNLIQIATTEMDDIWLGKSMNCIQLINNQTQCKKFNMIKIL